MSREREPICTNCRHFVVTWDEAFPRACEIYGFSCQSFPSKVVYEESGTHCRAFESRLKSDPEATADANPDRRRIRLGRLIH